MRCPKCSKDGFSKAGPFAMHVRFCKTISSAFENEAKAEFSNVPKTKKHTFVTDKRRPLEGDPLTERVRILEQQLAAMGKHIPSVPSGVLLTAKGAKSYLT